MRGYIICLAVGPLSSRTSESRKTWQFTDTCIADHKAWCTRVTYNKDVPFIFKLPVPGRGSTTGGPRDESLDVECLSHSESDMILSSNRTSRRRPRSPIASPVEDKMGDEITELRDTGRHDGSCVSWVRDRYARASRRYSGVMLAEMLMPADSGEIELGHPE